MCVVLFVICFFRAFGWSPPNFAHLPLLMNANGTKLSKRQGDINVDHFRESGIFPEVLLSFVTEFGGGFLRERGRPSVYNMNNLVKQVFTTYFFLLCVVVFFIVLSQILCF